MKKLDPEDIYKNLVLIEKGAQIQKTKNMKEKYRLIALFKAAEELVSYRIVTPPVVLNEDGTMFKCPNCNTIFEAEEGTYEDFDLCYCCGQIWKKGNTLLKKVKKK